MFPVHRIPFLPFKQCVSSTCKYCYCGKFSCQKLSCLISNIYKKNQVFPLCAIFWYSAQLWFEYLVFVLERFTIRNFKLKKTKGCRNDKINKYYWNGSQLMENQTNNSMQGFCATFLAFQLVDSQLMRTVLSEKLGVLLNQNMRNIRLSFFSHMPCFHISPFFWKKCQITHHKVVVIQLCLLSK